MFFVTKQIYYKYFTIDRGKISALNQTTIPIKLIFAQRTDACCAILNKNLFVF